MSSKWYNFHSHNFPFTYFCRNTFSSMVVQECCTHSMHISYFPPAVTKHSAQENLLKMCLTGLMISESWCHNDRSVSLFGPPTSIWFSEMSSWLLQGQAIKFWLEHYNLFSSLKPQIHSHSSENNMGRPVTETAHSLVAQSFLLFFYF